MVKSFGLKKKVQADPERVQAMLAKNDELLQPVIYSMANTVREAINNNAVKLGKIDTRLRSSINGRIRRNQAVIKTVMAALLETVQNAIAGTQGIVNAIATTPQVQQMIANNPQNPAYLGVVPQLPSGGQTAPTEGPAPMPSGLAPPPLGPVPTLAGQQMMGVKHGPVTCGSITYGREWMPLSGASPGRWLGAYPTWIEAAPDGSRALFVALDCTQVPPDKCAAYMGRMTIPEIESYGMATLCRLPPSGIPPAGEVTCGEMPTLSGSAGPSGGYGGGNGAPPPSPPPPGSQWWTILIGPPCPQFVAVPGRLGEIAAAGFVIPAGWRVAQPFFGTAAQAQAETRRLYQNCGAGTGADGSGTSFPPPP